jgi:hypothetical protein
MRSKITNLPLLSKDKAQGENPSLPIKTTKH